MPETSLPGTFSKEIARIFEAAIELVRTNGHERFDPVEDGLGGSVIERVLGPFDLRYDYHLNTQSGLERQAIQIWYERALVFSAWRSTYREQPTECIIINMPGVWTYFLRLRHERLKQRR